MKSLGWLTSCALALACAHDGKSVAGDSDTKMQGTVAAQSSQPQAASTADAATAAIRPFQVNVPEKERIDLRQRIAATPWPDREPVTDRSQGAPQASRRLHWTMVSITDNRYLGIADTIAQYDAPARSNRFSRGLRTEMTK